MTTARDGDPGLTPDHDTLRAARAIGLALGAGVTLFALVAWYLHAIEAPVARGQTALFYIWLGTAVTLCAVAILHWRHSLAALIEGPPHARPAAAPGAVLRGLLVSWALVEAAALFGVVVYFLTGITLAVLAGVSLIWAALALTWPQRDWFAAPARDAPARPGAAGAD